MARFAIYLGLVAIGVIGLTLFQDPAAVGLLTGVATAFLLPIIDVGVVNFRYARLLFTSIRYYRKQVRVSVSYLLQIEHRGKYLLVRGSRYPDQFQPVGGVYKFNPSAREVFRTWNVQSDDLIPIDKVSEDDLRIRVPGKHLLHVVGWFESYKNREVGPLREFHEELVAPDILPRDEFSYVRCDFVRRNILPIRYSDYAQSMELLIADIFYVELTDAQRRRIEELQDDDSKLGTSAMWATADQIRRRGAIPGLPHGHVISTTASWTL